jgi:hypothetical protein
MVSNLKGRNKNKQELIVEQEQKQEVIKASTILMQATEEQCYNQYTDKKGRFCARAVLMRYFEGYDDKGNATDKFSEATFKVQDLFWREGKLDSDISLSHLNDYEKMTFKEIGLYLKEKGY